jgi:hypothetical protein
MIVPNFTPADLKKLPLRAIIALAVRCAQRVEHMALLPDNDTDHERCRAAVGAAMRAASDFAQGRPSQSIESVVREIEACRAIGAAAFVRDRAMGSAVLTAHAVATALQALDARRQPEEPDLLGGAHANPFPHLAEVTADVAAREAFTAAVEAASAEGYADQFIRGALGDYEKLLRLDLGSYPQEGKPIDPSPEGPLGPLEREDSLR